MKITTDQAKRPNPQPLEAASIPEALLTSKTVTAVTGLSVATLYRLAAAGKLKPVKLAPRCTRWRASDVQAFIAGQGERATMTTATDHHSPLLRATHIGGGDA